MQMTEGGRFVALIFSPVYQTKKDYITKKRVIAFRKASLCVCCVTAVPLRKECKQSDAMFGPGCTCCGIQPSAAAPSPRRFPEPGEGVTSFSSNLQQPTVFLQTLDQQTHTHKHNPAEHTRTHTYTRREINPQLSYL